MSGMLMLPGNLPVKEYRGKLVADSRDVAALMGWRHGAVLRKIRTLCKYIESSGGDWSDFFIKTFYKDKKGEKRPCYHLTGLGYDLVTGKWTGATGAEFTVSYLSWLWSGCTVKEVSPLSARAQKEEKNHE